MKLSISRLQGPIRFKFYRIDRLIFLEFFLWIVGFIPTPKKRIPWYKRAYYLRSSEFAERIFWYVYDRLTDYRNSETWNETISDYIGVIDTLGSSGRNGKRTSSYTCEKYSDYRIHFGMFHIGLYIGSCSRFYIKLGR